MLHELGITTTKFLQQVLEHTNFYMGGIDSKKVTHSARESPVSISVGDGSASSCQIICPGPEARPFTDQDSESSDSEIFWVKRRSAKVNRIVKSTVSAKHSDQQVNFTKTSDYYVFCKLL